MPMSPSSFADYFRSRNSVRTRVAKGLTLGAADDGGGDVGVYMCSLPFILWRNDSVKKDVELQLFDFT